VTRLKICGLRDPADALVAVESGAAFLGMNFVPGVRRQITPERALEIIAAVRAKPRSNGPRLVGLFANQPLEDVNDIVKRCGLDMVQLCGDEPPEYWARVEADVIKQIKVRDDSMTDALASVESVVEAGHIAMLDKYEKGALGGTGLTFDWDIAQEVAERFHIMLAGGLSPGNVARAIKKVSPWGVDVSSGVETDGDKDPIKIRGFASEVARTDERGEKKSPSS
jgi:phosphoribosylanthranilate isomerase